MRTRLGWSPSGVCILFISFVAVCVFTSQVYPADKPAKKELIVVSVAPETIFGSQAMKYFGDLVTQRTNGQIKFKYYWSASLADAKETLPMLSSGGADIGFVAVGYYPAQFPLTLLCEHVMLSNHMDSTQKAVAQLYKEYPEFEVEFDRLNLKPLLTCVADISPLGTNKRVENIGDLKGQRIRTYGTIGPLLEAWGATPISLSSADVYQSMQTKLIDGFTAQPLQDFRAKSLDTVTKYLVEVGIGIYHTGYFLINKDTWNAYPLEIRKIMEDAAVEANLKSNEINMDNTRKNIPLVLKNKLEIYSVSESAKQEMRKIGLPAVKKGWIAQVVKGGINESKAIALLARFEELCTNFDKSPTTKNYWEIYQEEMKK